MGTIQIKAGKVTDKREDVKASLIKKQMEEVLKAHPHICGSCTGEGCDSHIEIDNDFVVRGVKTNIRQYVFECLCYKKNNSILNDCKLYTATEIMERYSSAYCFPMPLYGGEELKVEDLLDYDENEVEMLEEKDEFEEQYGSLLSEFGNAVVYRKRKNHK